MSYGLGVDLGTVTTAAATARAGRLEMVELGDRTVVAPAVAFARPDGRLLAGDAAARHATQDPQRTAREFRRRLGDPTPVLLGGSPFSPAMLMAAGLRDALDRATALHGGPPDRLVLTCPAGWRTYRREQLAGVPALAGVPGPAVVVDLVAEPVAAAAWYTATHRFTPGDVIAVYDLGGGTFDATLVRLGQDGTPELVGDPESVEWLGGVDFDEVVIGQADRALDGAISALPASSPADAAVLARVRRACAAAKEALSVDDEVTFDLALADRDARVTLTRDEFEALVRPMLSVTTEALAQVVESARLRPEDLAVVLLIGGSARMPVVSDVVGAAFDRPLVVVERPDQAVALGAARWAERRPAPARAAPRRRRRRPVVRRLVTGLAAVALLAGLGVGAAAYAVGPAQLGPDHFGFTGSADGDSAPAAGGSVLTPAPGVASVGPAPRSVVFAPDGRTAYVASADPDVLSVVDTGPGRVRDTIVVSGAPRGMAMSPDGRRLYVTMPGVLGVVDTETGQELTTVPVGPDPGAPAVTPDGRQVLVPDRAEATITLIDALHDVPISTLETKAGAGVGAVAVTADGKRAFVAAPERRALLGVDVPAGALLSPPVPTGPRPGAVAAGDGLVAVADDDSGAVSLVDPARAAVTATMRVGKDPQALAFGPDGRSLFVTDATDDVLSVVDTTTRRVTTTVPVGRQPVSVAVSAAGLVYVVNGGDRSLSVLRTPARAASLRDHG